MIMYGRLTEAELDKQGDDPYVFVGDRRYRITELVRRHDGGANYQAKEVTASEPEPAEPGMPAATVITSVGGGVAVEHRPPYKDPPVREHEPFKSIVPPLPKWARDQGLYKGHGPISKVAREKYRETFGIEE